MKLLIQSDLHIDYNKRKMPNMEDVYVEEMKKKKEDVVLIVGDIASNYKMTERIIRRLEDEAGKKVYFVIGNHDLYDHKDSNKALENMKKNKNILVNRSIELNDEWVIIGGFSWYDYSYKPPYVNEEEIPYFKKEKWGDGKYIHFEESDVVIANKMMEEIKVELEKYKNKKVIFMNHFIPYLDFVTFTSDLSWNVCNSFMGVQSLGDLLDEYENVKYVLFGHTHTRRGIVEYGDKKVISNPLGYYFEWKQEDFRKELEQSTIQIDL